PGGTSTRPSAGDPTVGAGADRADTSGRSLHTGWRQSTSQTAKFRPPDVPARIAAITWPKARSAAPERSGASPFRRAVASARWSRAAMRTSPQLPQLIETTYGSAPVGGGHIARASTHPLAAA